MELQVYCIQYGRILTPVDINIGLELYIHQNPGGALKNSHALVYNNFSYLLILKPSKSVLVLTLEPIVETFTVPCAGSYL